MSNTENQWRDGRGSGIVWRGITEFDNDFVASMDWYINECGGVNSGSTDRVSFGLRYTSELQVPWKYKLSLYKLNFDLCSTVVEPQLCLMKVE